VKREIRKNNEARGKMAVGRGSISAGGGSDHWRWTVALSLAILSILLYGNSLQNDFAFDDKPLIVRNKAIQSFGNIPEILGVSDPHTFLRGIADGVNYRPIRIVSFTIDYFFSGTSPLAYHVFNIIYHFLTAWVVFLVVMKLLSSSPGLTLPASGKSGTGRESPAFLTALITAVLFVVHPIQTNAVTYISGRRDVLSTLFYLLSLLYFLKLREAQRAEDKAPKRTQVRLFAVVCLFFVLAVFTKEMALSLPGVFFLVDFMQEFPERSRGRLLMAVVKNAGRVIQRYRHFYYPVIFISLLVAMHYLFFRGASDRFTAGWKWWGGSALKNFLTVATILVFYIKLMFFPVVLSADYSPNAYPIALSPWEPRVLFSVAVLVILAIMTTRWLRRDRVLAFGCIWFFVTLLPVSQIIPHHELLSEHYLYLPSIGFFIILSRVLSSLISSPSGNMGPRVAGLSVLVALVALWSVRTIARNPDWRSDTVLWAKTVQTVPNSFRAQFNMGNLMRQQGSLYKALEYFNRAVKIKPDEPRVITNIGAIYDRMGLKDRAFEQYQKALLADPEYGAALNNLGAAYITRGEIDKAIHLLTKATNQIYNFSEARLNLAIAYGNKFYTEEALKQFDIVLKMEPENPKAYYYRGMLFSSIGEPALAKRDMNLALIHDPTFPLPHLKLGEYYLAEKNMDKAAREFEQVVSLEPRMVQAHVNLGSIYAEKGEIERAIIQFRTALEIDPNQAAAHKGMGIIYLTRFHDVSGAIFHFRRSLELDPNQEGAQGIREFLANPEISPELNKLPEIRQGGG
jgi:tetratricopeptide (TPR) repeat protein